MTDVKLPTVTKQSLDILSEATPRSEVKQRRGPSGMMLDYVEVGYVIQQLDRAFNHLWEFKVTEQQIGKDQLWVKGQLTVHLAPGFSLTKEQYGGSQIKRYKKQDPVSKQYIENPDANPIDISNDLKAAASDALKKCASLLGVANDIFYGGRTATTETDVDPTDSFPS